MSKHCNVTHELADYSAIVYRQNGPIVEIMAGPGSSSVNQAMRWAAHAIHARSGGPVWAGKIQFAGVTVQQFNPHAVAL